MRVLKSQQFTPVNVKVSGEPILRGVELHPTPMTGVFAVHTGRRGRPRLVESSQIEKITAGKSGPRKSSTVAAEVAEKKHASKKTTAKKPVAVAKKRIVVVKKHKSAK